MKYAKKTLEKIEDYKNRGYEIIENKNWRYTGAQAGYTEVIKLAQTNGVKYPERIIWACK